MSEKEQRQFGLWDSWITPKSLAQGLRFGDVLWDDDGERLVWLEWRSGQGVLMMASANSNDAPRDLNSDLSVRARVGYGGGDFGVGRGAVYFSSGGRIYRQPLAGGAAQPITPAFGDVAAPTLSPDGRWLLFVHTYERRDALAIVDSEGKFWPQKLAHGDDFYMQPAWHPDGHRVAWIAWNHPQMPWDGTRLQMGVLREEEDGLPILEAREFVVGGEDVSVFQPTFSPDGRYLAYVSDETGWWQLYLYDLEHYQRRQLTDAPAEHGQPAWVQGMRTFGFSADGGRIYYLRNDAGFIRLWQYDLASGQSERLPLPEMYTDLTQISVSPRDDHIALLASGGRVPPRVLCTSPAGATRIYRRATTESVPVAEYAAPEPISWPGKDGGTVYGLYYPPTNSRFAGTGKPPLIVSVHGGPTSQMTARFNARAEFFTNRGYAFLEVNYRGSTGYGRTYRDMLKGNWGIYDVDDSVAGARYLVESGRVDGAKLVIMGGSAGGFTVLKALEDYPGFFKAGVCLYGVSNQFLLAMETHKFEERYNDTLLGPLPEAAALYHERSPLFFADKIQDPIAVFQGEIDRVVPKEQSDSIVASLQRRGIPHEYHVYAGEGHGWRKSETVEAFYKSVEAFLRQHVIFA